MDELPSQMLDMSLHDSQTPSAPDGSAAGTSPVMPFATTSAPDGAAGTSQIMSMFTQGGVMVLQSVASGRVLCIYEGQVSGKGIRDSYSQFVVHVRWPGVIALQNVANPDCWLSIFEGKTLGSGNGGPYSEFNLHEIENKYVSLESAFYSGQYVGIQEDGVIQPPRETPPQDRVSLFIPFPHSPPVTAGYRAAPLPSDLPPAAPRPSSLSESDDPPPPYPGPNTSQQSHGYWCQEALDAGAMAGAAALASPDPTTLSPYQPPPTLSPYQPPPTLSPYQPPPTLSPYQPPPTLSPYQPPPTLLPYQPPSHMLYPTQQQGLYPPQPERHYWQQGGVGSPPVRAPHRASQAVLNVPTAPVGYQIMDLFNRFNLLTFIPKVDLIGRPVRIVQHGVFVGYPRLKAFGSSGSFISADCEFVVEVTPDGGMLLKNLTHGLIVVGDSKKVYAVKSKYSWGQIQYEFVIRSISGAVVAFESVKFPGHFLSVRRDSGVVKLEKLDGSGVNHVHFIVRVNKFNGHYSQVITSPFSVGRPSIVNQLKDMSVIQLYYKPTMRYICLFEGGKVQPSTGDDTGTFLVFRDRGMGRVSLTSYHLAILKLRMLSNGKITSVGVEDVNMDFYVKENPDGSLTFESVPFRGYHIYLKHGKGKDKVFHTDFSVYLLDMNRALGQGKSKTIPKYALN